MKQGWEVRKLGDVCTVIAGQSPEGKFYNANGDGLPFYQGKKEYGEKYIGEPTTWTTKVTKEAEANDILMSVRAPVGPINFATQKICIGRGLAAIRATQLIDYEFLFNFLLKHESEIVGNAGAVFNSINKAQIENIELLLPPLPEQQRIVAILDEAFAAIVQAKANAEQNLKNAKELFESYLQSVFENKGEGWEEKSLGKVVDNIMTGPFGSMLHKSDYIENGIPVVNPQNIVNGQIISIQKTMVNTATFNRLEKYSLKKGDIVVARRGEMGRCAIVKNDNVGWICGTGSFIIRVNDKKANSEFLNIILSSSEVKKQLEKTSIGATMSNLNQSILSELVFNVPPLQEQQVIVQKLDALSAETKKLETIYQQKINDLDELKKSILQKAFTGELNTAVDIA
jgi:type I restriction enzyme S subunit